METQAPLCPWPPNADQWDRKEVCSGQTLAPRRVSMAATTVASTGCRAAITCLPHESDPGNGGLEPQTQCTARLTRLSVSSFLSLLTFSAAKPATGNTTAQISVAQKDLLRLKRQGSSAGRQTHPRILAEEASSLEKGSQEIASLPYHH